MTNWGVFEEENENGEVVRVHVAPMVQLAGEAVLSAAHRISIYCECGPRRDAMSQVWNHYDPDHPGALSEDEWRQKVLTKTPESGIGRRQ